ncbi:MAG: SGNH/GDSL hydrolase family protein [Candidatus Obscuribacterales bacterium]|nr:SGNH/GDSL hydrolase family protein [Candidatus Obscuribacterales bacterium]
MSIDFYPAQDAEAAGIKTRDDCGAASLFFCNEDKQFPEFERKDLKTMFPGIQFENFAIDGATCEDLLSEPRLTELKSFASKRVLTTITIGGNDLLSAFRISQGSKTVKMAPLFNELQARYKKVLHSIRAIFPQAVFILNTVFDPTDATGILPTSSPLYSEKLPIEFLTQFNSVVKSSADDLSLLADVHEHFRGHGAECGAADQFWYWKPSPIEPSYRGATEIRRVWHAALTEFMKK